MVTVTIKTKSNCDHQPSIVCTLQMDLGIDSLGRLLNSRVTEIIVWLFRKSGSYTKCELQSFHVRTMFPRMASLLFTAW